MLDYVALYPETLAMVKRYPASDRALLYEAMVFYGTDGSTPDWPEDDLKWLIWESLRQRVDAAAKKSETNRRNRQRTQTNDNETKRNETNDNEPQRDETNRNPDTETETDPDSETETEPSGVLNTHTDIQQGDTAHAHARPGWFDPEHPDAGDDGAWRYSEPARKATAQRILAYVINSGILREQFSVDEDGQTLGEDLFEVLCCAMKYGMTPREAMQEADDWHKTWQWERELRRYVISQGGSVDLPDRRTEQDFAYG